MNKFSFHTWKADTFYPHSSLDRGGAVLRCSRRVAVSKERLVKPRLELNLRGQTGTVLLNILGISSAFEIWDRYVVFRDIDLRKADAFLQQSNSIGFLASGRRLLLSHASPAFRVSSRGRYANDPRRYVLFSAENTRR